MHSKRKSDSPGRSVSESRIPWVLLKVPVLMALGVSALVWTRIVLMDAIIDANPNARPIFNDPLMVSLGLRYFLVLAPIQAILVIVLGSFIQRRNPAVKWFIAAFVWIVFMGALLSYASALAEIGMPVLRK